MREDDDLEVRGGIYIQYFASAHNGAVLQVQGGGGLFTALRGNAKMKLNRHFAMFVPRSF